MTKATEAQGAGFTGERQCRECGVTFRPIRRSSAYCSRPCARKKNGGWNKKPETWWVNDNGYIEGRVWIGNKQRRTRKHRYVVEQHIGRALLPHEDVHHIDGNKQNNAIENLEVLSHSAHSKISNSPENRIYKKGHKLKLSDAERARRAEHMRNIHRARKALAALAAASPSQTGGR